MCTGVHVESQFDAPMFATLDESCEWLEARGISRSPKQIIEAAAKGLLTLWAGLPDGAYIPFARRRKSTPHDTMHFIESGEDCPSEVIEFGERPSVKGEMVALTPADCVQFLQTNEAHIRGEGFENNARVSEALGDFGKGLIVKHIDALRLKGDELLSYHAEMLATSILEAEIARIDNLAWALGWLLRDRDASDEALYRQIQAWDERIRAMNLPTMDKAGRPARPSRGVPVAGFDKRESEYVAVASVRERAVEDHYPWPEQTYRQLMGLNEPDAEEAGPAPARSHGAQMASQSSLSSMAFDGAVVELPKVRQDRRLNRYEELGGKLVRHGNGWISDQSGARGALAKLIKEEAGARRPMSDKTDVRKDLAAAAERRSTGGC